MEALHPRVARLLAACVLLLPALLFLPLKLGAAPESLEAWLVHRKPEVRAAAARLLAETRERAAIERILDAFRDETDETTRAAMANALRYATKRDPGNEYTAWRTWWEGEGQTLFPPGPTAVGERAPDLPEALRSTGNWILLLAQAAVVAIAVGIFGMFVVAGYRLRKMNDITRRAEEYVRAAENAKDHFAGIERGLEARKKELLDEFARLQQENEAEIERFTDEITRQVEHRMREVLMTLRQTAEKELTQTLGELKEEVVEGIRQAGNAQREKLAAAAAGAAGKARETAAAPPPG